MTAPRPAAVAVLTPTGDDGPLTVRVLTQAGIAATLCDDLSQLERVVARGCGVVLVAAEALVQPDALADELRRQEPWSDLPILLLGESRDNVPACVEQRLYALGNVTLLDRPLRVVTLISAVRSALRARTRQYDVRDYLAERAQIQLQMLESQKLESLGVLAGGLAHDFNNLLTTVIGNADLAKDPAIDRVQHDACLDDVIVAAEQGARLTSQMLAYAGKGNLQMILLDLSRAVEPIVGLLTRSISPSITLRIELPPGLATVKVDLAQLHQVVMNLVLNAAEAIGDGQVGEIAVFAERRTITPAQVASMHTPPAAPGEHVALVVTDTGPGIPDVVKRRMFEPFFTTKFTGRGLGLSAVHGILRRHGAGLVLDTAPGHGTRFEIYFPLASGSPEPAPSVPSTTATSARALILVVDDDPALRKLTQLVLRAKGFEVLLAENGQAAIDAMRARSAEIRLVLLDATMPVMTAHQALPLLHAIRPDVPVLVMSGYGAAQLAELFPDQPGVGHLPKPFSPTVLLEAVRRSLKG